MMTTPLKDYEKVKTKAKGTGLVCPRYSCGGRFIVNYKKLLEGKEHSRVRTIVCPYCSKVSAIPEEDRNDNHGPTYLTDGHPED